MTDIAAQAPKYPADASNDNGPDPWDVVLKEQSYGTLTPDVATETVTITTDALHLDVAIADGQQSATYTADPGDGSAPMTIELDTDGLGGVGCYYASAGTYTVIVARDGTTIATQDVNPA